MLSNTWPSFKGEGQLNITSGSLQPSASLFNRGPWIDWPYWRTAEFQIDPHFNYVKL